MTQTVDRRTRWRRSRSPRPALRSQLIPSLSACFPSPRCGPDTVRTGGSPLSKRLARRRHDRAQARRSARPSTGSTAGRAGTSCAPGQQELVDNLLPQIAVPAEGEITPRGLFGDDRPLHFEIGFGSGEHLAYRADLLPDHGFIGAEPFLNGVATALGPCPRPASRQCPPAHGRRARRAPAAARRRVELPLSAPPRPWPKARHAKRRMVNDGPVDLFAAKLKPGGEFRLATDDPTYLELGADGHAAARRPVRMACREARRLPRTARRLDRDPLRRQVPPRRPPALLSPLPAAVGRDASMPALAGNADLTLDRAQQCLLESVLCFAPISCRLPQHSRRPGSGSTVLAESVAIVTSSFRATVLQRLNRSIGCLHRSPANANAA